MHKGSRNHYVSIGRTLNGREKKNLGINEEGIKIAKVKDTMKFKDLRSIHFSSFRQGSTGALKTTVDLWRIFVLDGFKRKLETAFVVMKRAVVDVSSVIEQRNDNVKVTPVGSFQKRGLLE